MNTLEARQRLAELASSTIHLVSRVLHTGTPSSGQKAEMRDILQEARETAYDAGYPGDSAWRAILRASVYIGAPPTEVDGDFWSELVESLQEGIDQLTSEAETTA